MLESCKMLSECNNREIAWSCCTVQLLIDFSLLTTHLEGSNQQRKANRAMFDISVQTHSHDHGHIFRECLLCWSIRVCFGEWVNWIYKMNLSRFARSLCHSYQSLFCDNQIKGIYPVSNQSIGKRTKPLMWSQTESIPIS